MASNEIRERHERSESKPHQAMNGGVPALSRVPACSQARIAGHDPPPTGCFLFRNDVYAELNRPFCLLPGSYRDTGALKQLVSNLQVAG
jgi:hypothetical protein